MIKKKALRLIALPAILILAACASLQLPGTNSSNAQQAQQANGAPGQNGYGQPGQPRDFANEPIEMKLAQGTLKLEGTDQAVTADQAKTLLPLWKAVKSLSSSTTATTEEINAVYSQIQEAMTADQIQTIKDMKLTQEDIQAMMKQYNIQFPQMGNFPTLSPEQQATRQARRTSGQNGTGGQTGRGNFQGGPGGPGGMPPDGGGFPGGGQNGSRITGTPPAGMSSARRMGGLNTLWVDPLIKILEQRAGG